MNDPVASGKLGFNGERLSSCKLYYFLGVLTLFLSKPREPNDGINCCLDFLSVPPRVAGAPSIYPVNYDVLHYHLYTSAHTHRSVYVVPPRIDTLDLHFVMCLSAPCVISVLRARSSQIISLCPNPRSWVKCCRCIFPLPLT